MAGKKIGVLALQGAFAEHQAMLNRLGIENIQVRTAEELAECSALIIPGGESTTIGKLMEKHALTASICRQNLEGMPIWGTCAGMILLAKRIEGLQQFSLGLMDATVVRNAFGRQVDSFEAELEIKNVGTGRGVFIRAPYLQEVGPKVEVLATYQGKIVMVQEGNLLATAFHPELTEDTSIHAYFAAGI